MRRCRWCQSDELLRRYHDEEWGEKAAADEDIFERLMLEIFQAGLSWKLVLKKRASMREAFCDFDLNKAAFLTEEDINAYLHDPRVIRHRKKLEALVFNANQCLLLKRSYGSLRKYLDQLHQKDLDEVIKELKNSFRFVGDKTAYSFLEAMGLVEPKHDPDCWKYKKESRE